jgi:putative oxidoreductase
MTNYLHPVSRAFVALIFIISGLGKVAAFAAVAGMMGGAGFPAPSLFLLAAITIEIVGGTLLLLGWQTRPAVIALIIFLIPATIVFHVLPMSAGGQAMQTQMVEVLKNLAIMGALLKFLADGAGEFALDNVQVRRVATRVTA